MILLVEKMILKLDDVSRPCKRMDVIHPEDTIIIRESDQS